MTDLLKFYIEDIILKEEVLKSKFLKKRNSRQGNEIYLFDYYNSPFSKVGINNGAKSIDSDEGESFEENNKHKNVYILYSRNPTTKKGKIYFKQNIRKNWINYSNLNLNTSLSPLYDLNYFDYVNILNLYASILEIPKNKFLDAKITQVELGVNLSFGTGFKKNERIGLEHMLSCFGKYKNVPDKHIYGNYGVCFKAQHFEISIYDKLKRIISTKEIFKKSLEKRKKINRAKLSNVRFLLRYELRILSEAHFNQGDFEGKIDTLRNLRDNWDIVLKLLYKTTDNIEFYDFLSPEIEKDLMKIGLKSKALSEFYNFLIYRGFDSIGYDDFKNFILPLVNKKVRSDFEEKVLENYSKFRDKSKYRFSYQRRFLRALENRLDLLRSI